MSTRGCIALGTVKQWTGVYQHFDSYPSGLGARVWEVLHEENGIEKFKNSIEAHPGGWSVWREKCYCHDPYFSQRDGSAAKDSPYYNEDAPNGRMTQADADPLFMEWVYVLDEDAGMLHVLEGGYKPRIFTHRGSFPLDSDKPGPDWEHFK